MSTKSDINISTIWGISKVEIVPEAPGGKLISRSSWGEGWKAGGIFFLISLGKQKEGATDFLFHFQWGGGVIWSLCFWLVTYLIFQIITNPQILFVDEPTSGLDSFMAESVIIALQKIANEGKTILATIHQPSSEVFQLFDRWYLLFHKYVPQVFVEQQSP